MEKPFDELLAQISSSGPGHEKLKAYELLDATTSTNSKPAGASPLHLLSSGNTPGDESKSRMVGKLLAARAHPAIGDATGCSPLHKALGAMCLIRYSIHYPFVIISSSISTLMRSPLFPNSSFTIRREASAFTILR
jgi:hypothetical protein